MGTGSILSCERPVPFASWGESEWLPMRQEGEIDARGRSGRRRGTKIPRPLGECGGNFAERRGNWTLRQIGRRNKALHHAAREGAEEIKAIDSKSPPWIAGTAPPEISQRKGS